MIQPGVELNKIILLTSATVIVIGGYVIWKKKNKKLKPSEVPLPTKWRKVGEVSNIVIFPLKSGYARPLNSAECTDVGLREVDSLGKHSLVDRSFMLFDETTKKRVTIREYAQMCLIKVTSYDEDTVVFSSPGHDDLTITLPNKNNLNTNNNFVDILMWFDDKVCAIDCGEVASDWFTNILVTKKDARCRLAYYARDLLPARNIHGPWAKYAKVYKKMDDEYMGSYSNIASYMVMTESSLDDLNNRLNEPVTEYNFRPNIMVRGTKPFEEDQWDWLKLGEETVLRSFKLCTRCILTTTNPETGIRNPKIEPLTTLKKYRSITDPALKAVEHQTAIMGVYMGLHRTGFIKIGDPVYVNSD